MSLKAITTKPPKLDDIVLGLIAAVDANIARYKPHLSTMILDYLTGNPSPQKSMVILRRDIDPATLAAFETLSTDDRFLILHNLFRQLLARHCAESNIFMSESMSAAGFAVEIQEAAN